NGDKLAGTITGGIKFTVERLEERFVITVSDASSKGYRLDATATSLKFDRVNSTNITNIWTVTP
ncbi:hypothetical protein, partial [Clostridium transplantifaecale]